MANILSPGVSPPGITDRQSFRAGMLALAPVTVGVIPFGLIVGVLMISVGIAPLDAWCMTVALMSGAAHVAVVDLMARNTPVAVIIFTGVVINLRFLMYSATLGPYLRGVPLAKKACLSYLLSDQAFAVSMVEFQRPDSLVHKVSFYAGAALLMFLTWIASVTAGICLGAAVPKALQLDFAIPLTFMALLAPTLRDCKHCCAALVAAILAILANSLPWGLGLMLAAIGGVLTGFFLTRKKNGGNTCTP